MQEETEVFLRSLFASYPEPFFMELRPLYPQWQESILYPQGDAPHYWRLVKCRRQWYPPAALPQMVKIVTQYADKFEMYMGVLPRMRRGAGNAETLGYANYLWCDIDKGNGSVEDTWRLLHASKIPSPHIIVNSGSGGLHCYFRLAEIAELNEENQREEFKNVLHRLVKAIGGEIPQPHADLGCAFPSCTLRIAGTKNLKIKDNPRSVYMVVNEEEKAYPYSWWLSNLPKIRKREKCFFPPAAKTGEIPARLLQLIQTPVANGTGHRHRLQIAAWCALVGLSEEEIVDCLLQNEAIRSSHTPFSEIQNLARSAYRKFGR